MTEPVSKKSGSIFRKTRSQKNDEFKCVVDKTLKIQTFFQPKKAADIQSSEHVDFNNTKNTQAQDNSYEDQTLSESGTVTRREIGIFWLNISC